MLPYLIILPMCFVMLSFVSPRYGLFFLKKYPELQTKRNASLFWIVVTIVFIWLINPTTPETKRAYISPSVYLKQIDSLARTGNPDVLAAIDSLHKAYPHLTDKGIYRLAMGIKNNYPDSTLNYLNFLLQKDITNPSEPYTADMIRIYLHYGDTARSNYLFQLGLSKKNLHVLQLRDSIRLAEMQQPGSFRPVQ